MRKIGKDDREKLELIAFRWKSFPRRRWPREAWTGCWEK